MKIRLAVASRMFAGASYIDVALLFGIAKESVFHIMWQVVDAINNTPTVGPFFILQIREECTRQAKEWEVGARVFVVNHQVWCPAFLAEGLSGISSAFLPLAKQHRSEGVWAFVVQKRLLCYRVGACVLDQKSFAFFSTYSNPLQNKNDSTHNSGVLLPRIPSLLL